MIRLLIYGGCHALILRDLLKSNFSDIIESELLINFHLIDSGEPFPYHEIKRFDLVLFSPIENKGSYNTCHLEEACGAVGVRAICYPWLEWHGYCPGATKVIFKGRFQWHYNALLTMAEAFTRFEDFRDHVVATFPDDALIDTTLARSSAMVAAAEERHRMDIRVSTFILENFRRSRLFLISDHPAGFVYLYVIAQLFDLLGLDERDRIETLDLSGSNEPQGQWRTPIFPRVARRLGLAFEDEAWVDAELLPGSPCDLSTYLKLYFYRDSVILGPVAPAAVVVENASSKAAELVGEATRLLAQPVEGEGDAYELLGTLAGGSPALAPPGRFGINVNQWRSTWPF